jgi:hypothetical protein
MVVYSWRLPFLIETSAGYTSIDKYGAAYKYHTKGYGWFAGYNLKFLSEGAQLFYPIDRTEAKAVFDTLNDMRVNSLLIGIARRNGDHYFIVDG